MTYRRKTYMNLPLYVLEENRTPIMVRDWMDMIKPQWRDQICEITNSKFYLDELLKKWKHMNEVNEGLKNHEAKIYLKPQATPICQRARQLSSYKRELVEKALKQLLDENIIGQVEYSEWATPIVPVSKANGQVRICVDYSTTVNPQIFMPHFTLPRIEDIFADLNGQVMYSIIDLASAYHQMPLSEESRKITTITTHIGLFQFTRLPFGLASAPLVWQKAVDQILSKVERTRCYLYDLIVIGKTKEDHLQNLDKCFSALQKAGVEINLRK
ncbi:Retrovirus-related Pol polyprotein [Thelohanellus kitauei]|uniref:Retrovirus-related Pol polyprotein n=1 Tax=Thelohanellus kitauei TaxID=669202 RepID=A0A0C2JIB7_THEKT|nr:Retrovirus-related Pol polyprotein [Thelohanellus kitauei]